MVLAATLLATGCSRDRPSPEIRSGDGATTTIAAPVGACRAAPSPPAAGDVDGVLSVGGVDRRYVLYVPPGYDGETALPVVFDFHGYGSSAEVQLVYTEIRPIAEREGFAVVAPQGQGSPPHFNLAGATATEGDDVEFTIALLDEVGRRLCVEESRVYALGMSNGGAMSSVLACRLSDRFAAVGAVGAVVYTPACDVAPRATPIVSMMGTDDPIVPFEGGRVNCCAHQNIAAAPDTMARFAARAGCRAEPHEDRVGASVVLRRFVGCEKGAAVAFYVVEGGGHTWPGSGHDLTSRGLGATTTDLKATETLWDFFERHRLASG